MRASVTSITRSASARTNSPTVAPMQEAITTARVVFIASPGIAPDPARAFQASTADMASRGLTYRTPCPVT